MIKQVCLGVSLLVLLMASTFATEELDQATSQAKAGEQIDWQVISSGGTKGTSTNYKLMGTAGQTAVGHGSSTNYGLGHGYWQPLSSGGSECCLLRADINHDGVGPDISDLVYLVSYMFQGGPQPPCEDPVGSDYFPEADIDGNMTGPDISDLVYLVTYMFQSGPPPIPCP